ncbi:MAG: hypothetical protein JSR72_19140 [Proteobacteria bacterium]|nr:hypothetical protein [Pseudomonadota bacterium]
MPLPADERRIPEPDLTRGETRDPGLTPERRAALDALERELSALLEAASRRAA